MSTRFGATAYLPTTKARCHTPRKMEFSRIWPVRPGPELS
jgi:hypothetical protein